MTATNLQQIKQLSKDERLKIAHKAHKAAIKKSTTNKSITIITPTRSVIEGWNGTVAGVRALALSLERSKSK